jgi:ribosomal protein S18 acetylase RimI-like enzyme
VGIAALYRREEDAQAGELLQVWVSPEYRGARLAWDLMDAIFQWAGENHFHSIIAGVTKANARAVSFYTRYGFSMLEETSTGCYLIKEVQRSMPS